MGGGQARVHAELFHRGHVRFSDFGDADVVAELGERRVVSCCLLHDGVLRCQRQVGRAHEGVGSRRENLNIVLRKRKAHRGAFRSADPVALHGPHLFRPRVEGVEVIEQFLLHRREVVVRRTEYELRKAKARAHILEGLIIALDDIDAIIDTIRSSPDTPSARAALMQNFGLSEIQSQAILDMRLAKLTGLERDSIRAEHAELVETIADLDDIIRTPARVRDIIKDELTELEGRFGDDRRTQLVEATGELSLRIRGGTMQVCGHAVDRWAIGNSAPYGDPDWRRFAYITINGDASRKVYVEPGSFAKLAWAIDRPTTDAHIALSLSLALSAPRSHSTPVGLHP